MTLYIELEPGADREKVRQAVKAIRGVASVSSRPPHRAEVEIQPGDVFAMTLAQAERELVTHALRVCGGNREKTAARLGMGERTLYRKLTEYGLRGAAVGAPRAATKESGFVPAGPRAAAFRSSPPRWMTLG